MNLTTPRIRQILAERGFQPKRIRPLGGNRNQHWMIGDPDGPSVLRRYGPGRTLPDAAWEHRLLQRLHLLGLPVPLPLGDPFATQEGVWSLFSLIDGRMRRPRTTRSEAAEQRERGRLLASLHLQLKDFTDLGQRPGWLPAHEGLFDSLAGENLRSTLEGYEIDTDASSTLIGYLDVTVARLAPLLHEAPQLIVIHGDFAPWNLRYEAGRLTGILDFETSHLDLRVAEFALSWRGRHDPVIEGYQEVSPLQDNEKELIVPVARMWYLASAAASIRDGSREGVEWALAHLRRTRSS